MLNLISSAVNKKSSVSVNNENGQKKFRWMLIDSAIVAGVVLFSANIVGDVDKSIIQALWSAGLAFFIQLIAERGIKR